MLLLILILSLFQGVLSVVIIIYAMDVFKAFAIRHILLLSERYSINSLPLKKKKNLTQEFKKRAMVKETSFFLSCLVCKSVLLKNDSVI